MFKKNFILLSLTCIFSALNIICVFLEFYIPSIVCAIVLPIIAIVATVISKKKNREEFSSGLKFRLR